MGFEAEAITTSQGCGQITFVVGPLMFVRDATPNHQEWGQEIRTQRLQQRDVIEDQRWWY